MYKDQKEPCGDAAFFSRGDGDAGISRFAALRLVGGLFLVTVLLLAFALALDLAFDAYDKRRGGVFDKAEDVRLDGSDTVTFLIDAGHGGIDGGAVGYSGSVEKELNLDIALKLGHLLELCGVDIAYTRTEDVMLDGNAGSTPKVRDTRRRAELADTCGGTLISIHMNSYPAQKYRGLQVFYADNGTGSDIFAERIQEYIRAAVQPENKRKAKPAPKTVWLTSHISAPAVIIECGFISNPEEEALLSDEAYRAELSAALCAALIFA